MQASVGFSTNGSKDLFTFRRCWHVWLCTFPPTLDHDIVPVLSAFLVSLEVESAHALVIVVPVHALLGTITLLDARIGILVANFSGIGVHRLSGSIEVKTNRGRGEVEGG